MTKKLPRNAFLKHSSFTRNRAVRGNDRSRDRSGYCAGANRTPIFH